MTPKTPAARPRARPSKPAAAPKPATVARLLKLAEDRLEARNVEFPDASAIWLLAHVLGEEDPDVLEVRGEEVVRAGAERRFWQLVERREEHEPFQYIVGLADFRGKPMEVEHGVFLPRLQSERLCDEVEAWAAERRRPRGGWRIADLGTGSGAVAVSLALGPMAPTRVWAVDIEPVALDLVGRNARRHGVEDRVRAVAGDWLSMFRAEPVLDVICAVPPFLNPGDEKYMSEESLLWEPREAFIGQPSGDQILVDLLDAAGARLRRGGVLALQLDSDQIAAVEIYANDDPDHPLTVEWILQDEEGDEDGILAVRA